VVDDTLAVTNVDQGLEHGDDVFAAERARPLDLFTTDTTVELHPADGRQAAALGSEEQVVEQRRGRVLGWRLAGTHHAIDLDQRFELIGGRVDLQGVRDEWTAVDVVGIEGLETDHLCLDDLGQHFDGQLGIALGDDLAGRRMHDRLGNSTAKHVVHRHFEFFDAGLVELIDVTRGNATALLDNQFAAFVGDIERSDLATQALRHQFQCQHLTLHVEDVGVVERVEDFLGAVIQRAQQYGSRQLATTVDTHEHGVLWIELEVQPGAAVRNDTCRVQQLARAMRLATVVIEE